MSEFLGKSIELPCGVVLENRIAKAAMSERLADVTGAPNARHVQLYKSWGEGGAGMLLTGNVMIDRTALGERGNVFLEDDSALAQFKAWTRAAGRSPLWMQINHPGRQSPRFVSKAPVAPSAVPVTGMGGAFAVPRALTASEIEGLIERFARTAKLAKAGGFAGVQIHGAHGYLVSQFLSPKTNLREDDWGGSDEKRSRFLLEVVKAVREAVGPAFPVSVKLNSADFQRGGFTEEASMAVVKALDSIDLLEISGGTYESAVMFEETQTQNARSQAREAFFLDYAEKVRRVTQVPLMVTGGFRTASGMEEALNSGAVDVVGLGRPLAVQPDLPAALIEGRVEGALPVRLSTGVKKLDAMIQGAWYQVQIQRMAAGLPPKPELGRAYALYRAVVPKKPSAKSERCGKQSGTPSRASH